MATPKSNPSIPRIHTTDLRLPSRTTPSSLKWKYDPHGTTIDDYGSSSPYRKGLTDHSTSCPAYPQTPTHTLHHYLVSTPPSSSAGGSSQCHAGLTDNSLALYDGRRSDPPSASSSCVIKKNLRFWLKRKDAILKKLNILGQSSSSLQPKSAKIMTDFYGKKVKRNKEVVEEKAVRERVSEEASKVDAKLFEEITEKEEVSEYGLVGKKEKSLRDQSLRVSEKRDVSESLFNDGKEIKQEMLKVTAEKGNEKQYVWASKYQPMALDDFICNREKAIQLQALVRLNSLSINLIVLY